MKSFLKVIMFFLLLISSNLFAAHGTVEGTVTDALTSLPISGATVSFYRQGGILDGQTTTDINGFYTFNADPHNYIMTVDAPGYQQVVLNIKIDSNTTITVNVSMQGSPGNITGNIGGPAPGSTTLNLYLNNVLVNTTTTDGSNNYSFPGLAPGDYVITAQAPGYGTQSKAATVITSGTTVVNFTLTLLSSTLNGTVLDQNSSPLDQAVIQVYQNNILITQTQTNASGTYTITGLTPGNYVVQAQKITYASSSQGAILTAGGTTTCNFVLMSDPGELTGIVIDNTSTPISEVTIQVTKNNVVVFSTSTGSNGRYDITGIAPGSYVVIASKANYQTVVQGALIVSDQVTVANFTLNPNPGGISGQVDDNTLAPIPGVLVEVNLNGIVLFTTLTDGSGNYSFNSLAPGSYIIHAHKNNYQSGIQGAIVNSNAFTTCNFTLSPNPGSLIGQVTDASTSLPLSGVLVEVNLDGVVLFTTLTDGSGNYQFTNLAPNNYIIHAHAANYQLGSSGVTITASTQSTLNFALLPDPATLQGKVVDIYNNPLSGVLVEVNYSNVVLFSTLTNSQGQYQITSIPPGTYSIHAHLSFYQSGLSNGVILRSDQTTVVNFTLTQDPATVQGTVTGSGPLAGATVEMNVNGVVVDSCLTNASGQYLLENQAAGSYVMHAHYPGYGVGIAPITLSPDQILTQNFNLTLATNTLSGTVTDQITSQVLSGAYVKLYIQQGGTFVFIDTDVSQGDGSYSFDSLASGTYKIIANRTGYEPFTSVNLSPTQVYSFSMIPLPLGPLSGNGEVIIDRFLARADRIHKISWKNSPSANVIGYNIYRNNELIKYVNKNDPLVYVDHHRSYLYADTYIVVSVSSNGYEGGSYQVTLR